MSDTEQDPLASVGASKVESKLSDSMVFDSSLYQDFEPVGEEGDSKAIKVKAAERDSFKLKHSKTRILSPASVWDERALLTAFRAKGIKVSFHQTCRGEERREEDEES